MRYTGFPKQVRDIILTRADNRCERCGLNPPDHIHHRRARAAGGTRRPETNQAANGLALCVWCHTWVESNRAHALEGGWLVRQTEAPAEVPVLRLEEWVLLDNNGDIHTEEGDKADG